MCNRSMICLSQQAISDLQRPLCLAMLLNCTDKQSFRLRWLGWPSFAGNVRLTGHQQLQSRYCLVMLLQGFCHELEPDKSVHNPSTLHARLVNRRGGHRVIAL